MKNFVRAWYSRLENRKIRQAEQKLLTQSIEAFEEWQRGHEQDDPIILEKLTRALNNIQSN